MKRKSAPHQPKSPAKPGWLQRIAEAALGRFLCEQAEAVIRNWLDRS